MISSLVLFIMPERTVKTDQITDSVGPGPFKFMCEKFELGWATRRCT
jgi:hypothetical protein